MVVVVVVVFGVLMKGVSKAYYDLQLVRCSGGRGPGCQGT